MKIEHMRWQSGRWEPAVPGKLSAAQLVLLFGCPSLLKEQYMLQEIQRAYLKNRYLSRLFIIKTIPHFSKMSISIDILNFHMLAHDTSSIDRELIYKKNN